MSQNQIQECEIKTKISGETLTKFFKIKKTRGLVANSEVIRQLIIEDYARMVGASQ